MKKWMGIAAIVIGCGVYAMVRLSISRYQDANPPVEGTPRAKQTEADSNSSGGNPQVKEAPRAEQAKADNTKAATPEEKPGSPVTAAQIAGVAKVFGEFQSALGSEDYEQAWKLMSESSRKEHSLEEFKKAMAEMGVVFAKATLRPESATDLGGRVRLLITHPSKGDERLSFVQENGQWKLDDL